MKTAIHEKRLAEGLCWRCGAKRADGSNRLCLKHLDYERDRKRSILGFTNAGLGRPNIARSWRDL